MRKYFSAILVILCLIFSKNCLPFMHYNSKNYSNDLKFKINLYKNYSYEHLKPAFSKVGLPYPPKKLTLIVLKEAKKLEMWGKDSGAWKHVKDFKIYAASGHAGPKLHEGDRQVPEGIYEIEAFNPNSHFDLSMKLNYPNKFDKIHASLDGRDNLGGDIFIHGKNRSIGCIAIGDDNIEQLFVLSYLVGEKNIKVIVAPNDFRKQKPLYNRHTPKWTHTLYVNIKHALDDYKA